ncbi:uncharacterized protein LOC144867296 [Branchiostoma floridae x Branchiostoma japonicum]
MFPCSLAGGQGENTVIIIAAVVCGVVFLAIIGVGVFVFRRRKLANDKKDVELKERKPKPMGIARPYVQVPDSPTNPAPPTSLEDDFEGPYATSGSVPMSGSNPYDDVHFERDDKTGSVAGATAGPLDPSAEYATVNKNKGDGTPNPNTVYAQVNKDKKKKDKPTLAVDPSSQYATVDMSKKKKKDMPPPPEDPSAQYSEVKKGKKKDKKGRDLNNNI